MKRGRRMGLRNWNGALVYGWGHGWLLWAPDWFKRAVVRAWNPVSCWLWGHYWIGLPQIDAKYTHDECANCRARRGLDG